MDVKKAIACSALLPPPGDEVIKELGEMYLSLERQNAELVRQLGVEEQTREGEKKILIEEIEKNTQLTQRVKELTEANEKLDLIAHRYFHTRR